MTFPVVPVSPTPSLSLAFSLKPLLKGELHWASPPRCPPGPTVCPKLCLHSWPSGPFSSCSLSCSLTLHLGITDSSASALLSRSAFKFHTSCLLFFFLYLGCRGAIVGLCQPSPSHAAEAFPAPELPPPHRSPSSARSRRVCAAAQIWSGCSLLESLWCLPRTWSLQPAFLSGILPSWHLLCF